MSPTRVRIENRILHVSRDTDESGYLFLPWPVGPVGAMVTTTSTLRERAEPYNLMVELARGKLNQVRTQTGEWRRYAVRAMPVRIMESTTAISTTDSCSTAYHVENVFRSLPSEAEMTAASMKKPC